MPDTVENGTPEAFLEGNGRNEEQNRTSYIYGRSGICTLCGLLYLSISEGNRDEPDGLGRDWNGKICWVEEFYGFFSGSKSFVRYKDNSFICNWKYAAVKYGGAGICLSYE